MRKPGRARAAVAAPGVQFALQAVVRPESGGAVLQGHWRIRDDRGGPQPRAFRMNLLRSGVPPQQLPHLPPLVSAISISH